jgi:hypothetical protein
MRFRRSQIASMLAIAAAASLCGASTPSPSTVDSGAVDAVKRYVAALAKPDPVAAYALLTPAQQRYFRNARNFASNYVTTGYRLVSYSVAGVKMRNANLAQIDVSQTTSYYDVAAERTATVSGTEPYFALRSNGKWGVKEVFKAWKSYAPKASGRAGGLIVRVDRIEFYDHYIQVVCTLRNLGGKPVQVLPLLQSKLKIGSENLAAIDKPDFPLNDRQFFEGTRIYPYHQVVGYMTFSRSSQADEDTTATLIVGPAVEDGSKGPMTVSVGPMALARL